jgi:hypothetical protein
MGETGRNGKAKIGLGGDDLTASAVEGSAQGLR